MKCEEFYITKIGSVLQTLAKKKVRGKTVLERKMSGYYVRVLKETLIKISDKKNRDFLHLFIVKYLQRCTLIFIDDIYICMRRLTPAVTE